jgi:hypothetical protein
MDWSLLALFAAAVLAGLTGHIFWPKDSNQRERKPVDAAASDTSIVIEDELVRS